MSKNQKVFRRVGVADLVVEVDVNLPKYVTVTHNNSVKVAGDVELYHVGYEFEDGTECNEDGTEL